MDELQPWDSGDGLRPNLAKSVALLVVRLFWGWRLYLAGYRHLTHIESTYEAFVGWGVPLPRASVYLSGWTETLGGLLLLAGLLTRPMAGVIFFNFVVALIAASRDTLLGLLKSAGWWDHLGDLVDDAAFPFLMLGLLLACLGPGKLSLDWLAGALWRRHHQPVADAEEPHTWPATGKRPASA